MRYSAIFTALVIVAASGFGTASAVASETSDLGIVQYPHEDSLTHSETITLQGVRAGEYGCTFGSPPPLELEPGETAVVRRQTWTNFTTCETELEMGHPTTGVPMASQDSSVGELTDSGSTTDSVASTPTDDGASMSVAAAGGSGSGYYTVYWHDVIELLMTEVRPFISWDWDGSCVTASDDSGVEYKWREETGWEEPTRLTKRGITDCSRHEIVSEYANFENPIFCWPGVVRNYYRDIRVIGWYHGRLTSFLGDTWTTYPFACPTLHLHEALVRTS